MNPKRFIIILIALLFFSTVAAYATSAYGVKYTDWVSRSFVVGDGNSTNLNGNGIGNGWTSDLWCRSNCSGPGYTVTGINLTLQQLNATIANQSIIRTENLNATIANQSIIRTENLNATIANQSIIRTENLNASIGILKNASAPLSMLNRSNQLVFSANTSNISVTKQSNDSYSVDLSLSIPNNSITFQNITTGRAQGVVYQNTNNTVRHIFISALFTTTGAQYSTLYAYTDTSNPPTTKTAQTGTYIHASATNEALFFTFDVFPGNYYKLVSSGTIDSYIWVEEN